MFGASWSCPDNTVCWMIFKMKKGAWDGFEAP